METTTRKMMRQPDTLTLRRLPSLRRLRPARDGLEELLDGLLELQRVAGQIAHLLLQDLRCRPDERAAGAGPDLVGVQLVEELQLLIGVFQSLRIHVSSLSLGMAGGTAAPV